MKFSTLSSSSSGLLPLLAVRLVADVLVKGGLAVLPTETGHMLAALATSVPAVESAFAVKRRDRAKAMHIACSSLTMASRFAALSPVGLRVLGSLTPGPVTVVAPAVEGLSPLVTVAGTVGIRVPDHPATLQVIAEVGEPLTATSLNESGTGYAAPDEETLGSLDWPDGDVVYVVDATATPAYSLPSTLVSVVSDEPRILRAGPVSLERIRSVIG